MPASLRVLAVLASAQLFFPLAAGAEASYDSDWLIERFNGRWELAAKGAAGRVEKTAANQEVLRMGKDGTVLVISMPALDKGGAVRCLSSKRHDYRSPCSSAFLECSNANDGAFVTVAKGLLGNNMAEVRSRLECRMNTNAVLRAAKAVGMIETIQPVAERAARAK